MLEFILVACLNIGPHVLRLYLAVKRKEERHAGFGRSVCVVGEVCLYLFWKTPSAECSATVKDDLGRDRLLLQFL